MNRLRTAFLMAALTALFVFVGAAIGGTSGIVTAFVIALVTNFFAYWHSDKVLLSLYGAKAVDEASAPDLVHIVRRLSQQAGLPMPKVYITDNPQPNAFATGRDPAHAALCVTSGLLERVGDEELAGVIAHELGHVKNRDTLTMTVTAVMAGAISMLAWFAFFMGGRRNNPFGLIGMLVVTMLAPIAAMLVQAAISRTREFEADKAGAELTGRPLWLASALSRIDHQAAIIENAPASANPGTAHLFIVNPLHGGIAGLFSSHPSTQERVARLRAMAGAPVHDSPWA